MTPLWLALDLPRLALDVHWRQPDSSRALAGAGDNPVAVVAAARIVACDELALAAGVQPGMGLAAARVLAPQLAVVARDAAREAAALAALGSWAGSFTPRVALVPPHGLLLEIGGCLRYFGGAERILGAATQGAAEQGYRATAAVAPTPQGALWLAQAGVAAICVDAAMLAAALDALPLAQLDLPESVQQRLAGFGAHTLDGVRRLPRGGLARRIGAPAMAALARAYGELPDPRPDFVFPEHFAQSLELPSPVASADALLFAARRLTAALAGWLAARQAGLRRCTLHLCRRRDAATVVELNFATATRDAARLERVLRERLERLALPAPVDSLRLAAADVESLAGSSGTLFEGAQAGGEGIAALVERLRARLGESSVQGIAAVPDHRPECATRPLPLGAPGSVAGSWPRPFWLLAAPEPLAERAGRPWRNGPLQLLAGPERIESGWWQAGEGGAAGVGDARRDYFVALTADARWAWVYRDLGAPGGWYLHGWFG